MHISDEFLLLVINTSLPYFPLSVGASLPESGRHAVAKSQESKILKDNIELQHVQAGNATLMHHIL